MKHLIHYYGDWDKLPIPSHHSVLYVRWKEKDDRYNKISAILFPKENSPTMYQLIEYIVSQEKDDPVGVGYNHELL